MESMKIAFDLELTTEHPASSRGIPVLVIDGEAYGAGDLIPEMPFGEPLGWVYNGAGKTCVDIARGHIVDHGHELSPDATYMCMSYMATVGVTAAPWRREEQASE